MSGDRYDMKWLSTPIVERHQPQRQLELRKKLKAEIAVQMAAPLVLGNELPEAEREQIRKSIRGRQRWSPVSGGSRW